MVMKVVRSTRIIGRKRVSVPKKMYNCNLSSPFATPPPKKRGSSVVRQIEGLNRLESLPEEVLVKILCKVNHEDLKELLFVSKFVNEATLIAKELHFAYCTPRTKPVFRKNDDLGLDNALDDTRNNTPNAPKQRRVDKSRISFDKFASIAVALFPSFDDLAVEI